MVEPTPTKPSGSRLISRILPPAMRLWLLSQVEHVDNLVFRLEGCDREILSGHIPAVTLSAEKAIYQGIHLSQVAVKASSIRINLGQVMRRQPLRLLTPFPVSGRLCLTTADLNHSLRSPLLGQGLYDFFRRLAEAQGDTAHLQALLDALPEPTLSPYYEATASIAPGGITLRLMPYSGQSLPPLAIATQLVIRDGHRLCLENPHWLTRDETDSAIPLPDLQGFEIDLGSEVTLTECSVETDRLALAGIIRVLPAPTAD